MLAVDQPQAPGASAEAFHAANMLYVNGQLSAAAQRYAAILAADPDHFGALHHLGLVHFSARRLDEAARLIREAIARNPDAADAHNNLGVVLRNLGKSAEAIPHYQRALALLPDYADAHGNLGNALLDIGRPEEALASANRGLALDPDNPKFLHNCGTALAALGRFAEASTYSRRAVAAKPDFAEAHLDLGCQLLELQLHEEALQCYERAIALKPAYVEAFGNAASALSALGRCEEAIEWAHRALAINPAYIPALINLANTQRALSRYQEAIATYDRALSFHPDDPLAQWNQSLALLAIGDFARGWPKYEARRSVGSKGVAPREWSRPLWDGKADLAEATILLHAEQGLGDALQFARYVPLVARRAAAVALEVQRPLVPLLAGLRGVSSIHAQGDALPQFSYHCPLMSLPLRLKTTVDTIPAETPYVFPLLADVARWRPVIGDGSAQPQIGLVWAGNPGHRNDRQRSVALDLLRPLLRLTGVRFVALQRELRDGDAAILSDAGSVLSLGERLESLCDTAAVISLLDLVITVDTAVAHLAGAMGKPVWILLPFCPDFRWLLDREDSPWYPSARLFRQSARGDWRGVVDDVCRALAQRITGAAASLV